MNINTFNKKVEQVRAKQPIWFALKSDNIQNKLICDKVEQKLKAKLPIEYKDFILQYGGGYFGFTSIYSLDPDSDWNIVKMNQLYLHSKFIIFSDNGVGDVYGFKIVNEECESEVYFFDHECNEWSLTEYKNLFAYLYEVGLKGSLLV